MSMLDTIGGLGGADGVGGQLPSNSSAANSAASVAVNPAVALGGVGGGYTEFGPFSVNFPGAATPGPGAINAPPLSQSIIPGGFGMIALLAVALLALFFFIRR